MKQGDYCVPKDEREWMAILEIAQSLGMYGFKERKHPFWSHKWIWTHSFSADQRIEVNECMSIAMSEISTKDFIVGMYQLAEDRKKPKDYLSEDIRYAIEKIAKEASEAHEKCSMRPLYPFFGGPLVAPMQNRMIGQISNLEKRVKELEGQVWDNGCKISHAKRDASALEGRLGVRLEKLEKVVDDHLVKERLMAGVQIPNPFDGLRWIRKPNGDLVLRKA